jgi:drug/metabolite transporter (DMT)-like permease
MAVTPLRSFSKYFDSNRSMSHRTALLFMLMATALWSSAGVATRYLDSAKGFEITFVRSFFAGITILILWPVIRPHQRLLDSLRSGRAVWLSGVCWAIMFCCFMISLSLTTVGNVLVAQATGPVFTALLSWLWLKRQLSLRTWLVAFVAAFGIALMFILNTRALTGIHLFGFILALCIPIAAAVNWNLVEKTGQKVDFIAPIFIGALLSAVITLPLAFPLQSSVKDVAILGALGVFQLGIPCALCVIAAKHLPAPELSLLTLLETIFGIVWVALFTTEAITAPTLIGGSLVIGALMVNELSQLRRASS